MVQIFILGSSSVYGVGALDSGWADIIKQKLHNRMYSEKGLGQIYEVFNFGKAGATIDFVIENFPKQFEQFSRGCKSISIVLIGGNNNKAVDRPDNYVSTIEQYEFEMNKLIDQLKSLTNHVIIVGRGYYDESKTNPIFNPDIGGK